jgi:serine/threonine protein kinase/outer membrane protein assembly factor BamB
MQMPQKLGKYRILKRLGGGGMGEVFLAEQEGVGRRVALKLLPRDLAHNPAFLSRFQREAHALGKLSHPNICHVIEIDEAEGYHYYTMEYVGGCDLAEVIRTQRLTTRRIAEIGLQLAKAIHFAHRHGIVHRDLKPRNIILTRTDKRHEQEQKRKEISTLGIFLSWFRSRKIRTTKLSKQSPPGEIDHTASVGQESPSPDTQTAVVVQDAISLDRHAPPERPGQPPHSDANGSDKASTGIAAPQGGPAVAKEDETASRRHSAAAKPALREGEGSNITSRAWEEEDTMPSPDFCDDVHIIDFGLAREMGAKSLTLSGEFLGTPAYMAPEQATGERTKIGPPTDIYGIGAVMYEMATLKPPFEANTLPSMVAKVINEDPVRPRLLRPETAPDMETIILKCLEKNPRRRYQTAEELAQDIERFLADEPIAASPIGPFQRFWRKVRKHKMASLGIAAAACFFLAFGIAILGPGRLTIKSTPEGASIFINGEPTGLKTPVESTRIWPPGSRTISLKMDDFEEAMVLVKIGALSSADVSVNLTRHNGTLSVTSNVAQVTMKAYRLEKNQIPNAKSDTPADASQIENLPAPLVFTVPAGDIRLDVGSWRLVFEKENHFGCEQVVEIRKDQKTEVDADLEPMLLWSFPTRGQIESSTAVADINGDGRLEVVATSNDGCVYALEGNSGDLIWKLSTGADFHGSPAVCDLEGDGAQEIVVANQKELLVIVASDGTVKRRSPLSKGAYLARPAIANLNGDNFLDIIIAEREKAPLRAFSGEDLKEIWRFELDGHVSSSPALCDLDDDGVADIVIQLYNSSLLALTGSSGRLLWQADIQGFGGVGSPAIGRFDGDGTPDIITGLVDGKVACVSGKTGEVLWNFQTGKRVPSTAEIVDLTGDGQDDVIIGSGDNWIYAIDGKTARLLWKYETGYEVWTHLSSYDITGDGVLDVFAGSDDHCVYALSGKNGSLIWRFRTGDQVISAIELADVDGDGEPEAVFTSKDKSVYAVRTRKSRTLLWKARVGFGAQVADRAFDVDSDGLPDVLTLTNTAVVMLSGRLGRPVWRFDAGGTSTWASWSIADLTCDGIPDVLVSSSDNYLCALSGRDGALLWKFKAGLHSFGLYVGDLNRDTVPDIAVWSVDSIYAVSGSDGNLLWQFKHGDGVSMAALERDLNEDSVPDIIVSSGDSFVYALSGHDGTILWKFKTGSWATLVKYQADIDRDGICDVVVRSGSPDSSAYALSGRGGGQIWKVKIENIVCAESSAPEKQLLDGDDLPDIVMAFTGGRVIAISGRSGAVLWERQVGGEVIHLSHFTGDLNTDDVQDIVFRSADGYVYAVSGRDGALIWKIGTGKVTFATWLSPLCMVELNGDGVLDIVVPQESVYICAIDGRTRPLGILWTFSKWRQEERRKK